MVNICLIAEVKLSQVGLIDIMINATLPLNDITKHGHQLLEYVRCKFDSKDDILKGESVLSMDVWDFVGQHLCYMYASQPLFFSSCGIYILVHNLGKPLYAPANCPCT